MKKYLLPTLIALSALSISAAAAFYSVTGLSKLFAGVEIAVIWMASSLEVAKLVIASLLYQYWKNLGVALKSYLTLALAVLMIITSAGIYGYLSSGYQDTANKSNVVNKEIKLLDTRITSKTNDKTILVSQLQQTKQSISQLREALGNNTQTYKDKSGNVLTTTSSSNRKAYEKQLEYALKDEEKLSKKIEILDSTLTSLEETKLNVESTSELAGELGPLKYISKLTGKPMDEIINWFLLLLIFVFDPLAIALVIAANFAFSQFKKPEESIIDNPQPTSPKPESLDPNFSPPVAPLTPPPPAKSSFPSFIPPIFKRKKNEDDTITYN